MSDYKYEMQEIADEMAQERYKMDFYDLSPRIQAILYSLAMFEWHDRMAAKAEALEDR